MTRWQAGTVAVLATVITLGLAGPSGAQGSNRDRSANQEPANAEVELAFQRPWLAAGEPLELSLDLTRLTHSDRIDVVVDVRVAVRNRSAFQSSLDDELPSTRVVPAFVRRLDELPLDAGGAVSLSVPLPSLRAGVYPVSVTLRDRERDEVLDRFVTHAIRVADTIAEPLRVAWVQPLSAPPSLDPDGQVHLDDDRVMVLARLVGSLTTANVPLTLDATPETIAALRTANPNAAAAIAGGLVDRQLLTSPYVEVDASALVAAGLADDLSSQRTAGEEALRTAFGDAGDPRTWSSDFPLSTGAVRRLRLIGVSQVVVPDDGLSRVTAGSVDGGALERPFSLVGDDGQMIAAVAADARLTAHFIDEGDHVLAAHHLLADLALLQAARPAVVRGVVVRPGPDWRPSSVFVSTVLSGLASATIVRPVTVDGLFEQVPPLVARDRPVERTTTADPTTTIDPGPIAAARRSIAELVSLSGSQVESTVDLERFVLVAESTQLDEGGRSQYLDAVIEREQVVHRGIRLVEGRTYRLAGRQGTIPLTLVNDNPFPTIVTLDLSSEKLEFEGGTGSDRSRRVITSLELAPGKSTVVPIDVRARASAGFSMRVIMRTPYAGTELARSRFTVISPAVPNVGIVLSVGAGLFLVVWWVRNWRSTRRPGIQDLRG